MLVKEWAMGAFIRSIWLADPGEGTGNDHFGWIGSHQFLIIPELSSLQFVYAPWLEFLSAKWKSADT